MTTEEFRDIAVVGAGPCGLSVGIAARQAGLSCALYDRGVVVRTISRFPTQMTFFSSPERIELGGLPFISASEKPTRLEALKYYRRVACHFELELRQYDEVTTISGGAGEFVLDSRTRPGDARRLRAANVVIATGYFDTPNLLGVPGEDLPKVTHYFREAHPFFDQDCIVIGAGNSAVDAALELYRASARVTLVHFADELDAGVKPWVLPDITNRIRSGEISARWGTRVAEIHPASVLLRSVGGVEQEVPNDWVFAMTGYRPDPRLLDQLAVPIDRATGIPHHDPATMRTSTPGVFVAGVVAAGYDANKIFIENGREHGERIVSAVAAARNESRRRTP